MTKSGFIRAYADSLTVRELAEQLDCAPAYVRSVLCLRRRKVKAAVRKQREKAKARSRRRAEARP